MPIRYRIDRGVLVLEVVHEGFAELRSALRAAAADPAARPKMPLLLDVRSEVPGVRYEDVRYRVEILAQMRAQLGPRWAIVTGTGPVRVGVGRMYTVFSQIEGLEVGLFADEAQAIHWLTEPVASDPGSG